MPESLLREDDGPITVLTFNRPEVRNAINEENREVLRDELEAISRDRGIRAVILTGAGTAFCAGGDVKSMRTRSEAPAGDVAIETWRYQQGIFRLVSLLNQLEKVTIAAVNGPAYGLGLDLALACDFIVADPRATFSSVFVRRGLVPDGGGMYFLPRRVGLSRAKEMMFSGRAVDASEAAAIGLSDATSEEGTLIETAKAYAGQFTGQSRVAIMLMKSIVNRSFELSLESIAALGSEAQGICYTTTEHHEAVEAFLNR
jgi:enoyl-CoA hydratase/carnithine racemase